MRLASAEGRHAVPIGGVSGDTPVAAGVRCGATPVCFGLNRRHIGHTSSSGHQTHGTLHIGHTSSSGHQTHGTLHIGHTSSNGHQTHFTPATHRPHTGHTSVTKHTGHFGQDTSATSRSPNTWDISAKTHWPHLGHPTRGTLHIAQPRPTEYNVDVLWSCMLAHRPAAGLLLPGRRLVSNGCGRAALGTFSGVHVPTE